MQFDSAGQFVRDDLKLHIYSQALLNNSSALKGLCKKDTKMCAVVKANGYGHGIREIVSILKNAEVDFFAVANVYEALCISDLVESQNILIFEPIYPTFPAELIRVCAEKNFYCLAVCPEAMEKISGVLASTNLVMNLHVKVGTGMGRCGVSPAIAANLIKIIDKGKNLCLAGVCTHFATAKDDLSFSREQLKCFEQFLDANNLNNREDVIVHMANSNGMINLPESHFDMVRPGIALYGYATDGSAGSLKLEALCKLEAPIVQLNRFSKGQTVGYDRSFKVTRDITAAVIPIGYADGYQRSLSNKAVIKVGESFCPVIGKITMNQCVIDVTDVADVSVGQMVTVLDNDQNSPCGAYALAELAGTICYEILTSITPRAKRIIH